MKICGIFQNTQAERANISLQNARSNNCLIFKLMKWCTNLWPGPEKFFGPGADPYSIYIIHSFTYWYLVFRFSLIHSFMVIDICIYRSLVIYSLSCSSWDYITFIRGIVIEPISSCIDQWIQIDLSYQMSKYIIASVRVFY